MRCGAWLALVCLVGPAMGQVRHHKVHGNPGQLGKKLANIKGKKGAARAELRATREKAHFVKLNIQAVDNKLVTEKESLEGTKLRLNEAKVQRDKTAAQLATATVQLGQTKKQVKARLRQIYMQGDESGLSAISGTKTAGEIASQGFLMDAIKHKDRQVFNRYVALQTQVRQKKIEQDEVVSRVAKLENAEVAQTHVLTVDRADKANLLDDLRQRTEELQQMIRQFQADESQITNEIQAFERAYAAAAAAAAAAARRRHGGHKAPVVLGKFSGRFSRPVNAPITSTFGMRYHPILHRVRMHTGIDFGASFGTPIHAAGAGQVIFTSFMRGYGHVVIIDHGGGYSTVYAHTSRVFVSVGQQVTRGQEIAAVGATGLATGPHLHFEVRVNGHPVNPMGRL